MYKLFRKSGFVQATISKIIYIYEDIHIRFSYDLFAKSEKEKGKKSALKR